MNKNNVVLKFLVVILMSIPALVSAQDTLKNLPKIDVSPMDASYYPTSFPILKIRDKVTTPLTVKLIYSRPQLKGRAMFGALVPYSQVWRMGANEASEIEFFQDVTIGGKKIKKGEYSLYAIPEATEWTIIVNTENDVWGSFKYDESKDVVRVKVPISAIANTVESFTVYFDEAKDGCNLVAAWDKVMVRLPIQF